MRDKLIELIHNGVGCPDGRHPFGDVCDGCRYFPSLDCNTERLADYLIAHGVTFATDNNVGDKKPMTNGDRIRAMSNEELRDFLDKFRVETYSEPFGEKFCKSCPTQEVYCAPYGDTLKLTECSFADGVCPHGDSLAWWLEQEIDHDNG